MNPDTYFDVARAMTSDPEAHDVIDRAEAEYDDRMKVYLAGPITNNLTYTGDFARWAERIKDLGYEPVDPSTLGTGDHPWSWYMRRAVAMMLGCDAVFMLPGWQASRGAVIEHRLALDVGLPVYLDLTSLREARRVTA